MARQLAAGYSGKPLADKLGLKPGTAAAVVNPPSHYQGLLGDMPLPGKLGRGHYDFIHIFASDRADRIIVDPRF